MCLFLGRLLPTPAEGPNESLFGSKHQECRYGGARACEQNLARLLTCSGRNPRTGPSLTTVRPPTMTKKKSRKMSISTGAAVVEWGTSSGTTKINILDTGIQHVRPRRPNGAARGRAAIVVVDGVRRGSRHPARVELLRRVQAFCWSLSNTAWTATAPTPTRTGIADECVWARRDSD